MKKGMVVSSVAEGSIADELGLQKGDIILSVNGVVPKDIIELSFLIQEEEINLCVKKASQNGIPGQCELFEIEKDEEEDLGVDFECAVFDGIKPCLNKCIFCFVDQQPKGLRESLYVKDDDWRLSYLQGTYITTTNLTQKDWDRMEALRLSPLYVSIHTTNPSLRCKMLNNKKAGEILNNLTHFKKLGIEIHGQIVLCPSFNDGIELKRTLEDLKSFKKILKSLAIVPVGISKFRDGDVLKPVTKEIAIETIKAAEEFNNSVKKHIVMASDEIFLKAQLPIPDRKYYGKFVQIEDGVGAIRLLTDDFIRCKKKLKKRCKKPTKLTLVTGSIASKIFCEFKKDINVENLDFEIIEVKNQFFGDAISVAGLVVGEDIVNALKGRLIEHLIIPSVMFKEGSREFLDGKKVEDVIENFVSNNIAPPKVHIIEDCYNFKEILTIINAL